ncbi:MAG TPA: hypothetical protein VNN80_35910, partial [Polyangiaceae bacterium]|nr:hypothetical protein [Polyangiaceae bacterium]
LAYVAITRARRRLHISHVASRTIFGQTRYLGPSRFLEQLPAELIERRGLPAWATRVHAAAARARQSEFADPEPEEAWDQRATDAAPTSARPLATRGAPRAPSPAVARGERVVDYSAFDDYSAESKAPSHGVAAKMGATAKAGGAGLPRGTRVFHRRFGSGIVEQSEGPDKVVARFKGFGPKKVLLEYLTLKE